MDLVEEWNAELRTDIFNTSFTENQRSLSCNRTICEEEMSNTIFYKQKHTPKHPL